MRVAMISTPFLDTPPRGYGGTELVVHALCEGLVALGHEVVLFATRTSCTSGTLFATLDKPRWPPTMADDLEHLAASFSALARDRCGFDVVHVHSWMALALGRLAEAPLVYTLHHP